jgi:DNA-binding transcriptional LysR family regulator
VAHPPSPESFLLYHYLTTGSTWHFRDASGQEDTVRVDGRLRADNGDALVEAALRGVGILYVPDFLVAEHIHSGRLVRIMPDWCHTAIAAWAIYPHTRHLSAKVRLFIDFLSARFSPVPPWHCPTLARRPDTPGAAP